MAASQLRSCGSHARNRTGARVCCESASTSVIAGVWACRSWANEAEVKKMEPSEIGDAVGSLADSIHVRRHTSQREQRRANDEQARDRSVQRDRPHRHSALLTEPASVRGPCTLHLYRNTAVGASPIGDESPPAIRCGGAALLLCGTRSVLAWLRDHFGEMIAGCLRSKNSVSPTVSLPISSICACNSGGSSLRSPSRASASEVKYMTMV